MNIFKCYGADTLFEPLIDSQTVAFSEALT